MDCRVSGMTLVLTTLGLSSSLPYKDRAPNDVDIVEGYCQSEAEIQDSGAGVGEVLVLISPAILTLAQHP